MNYEKFSHSDMVEMLEIIQASLACKTELDIKILMNRVSRLVGAEFSVGGVGNCQNGTLVEVKHIINASYPDEWMMLYNKYELYKKDPIIWRQATNSGVQLWTDTYKKFGEIISKDFVDRAADFKIRFGVSGGVISSYDKTASIITFSGPKNNFKSYQKAVFEVVMPHIHQAFSRICMAAVRERVYRLTVREKEILKWLAEGKTNWEIGSILNISERTAKFHVNNIERKLNAASRHHAVAIAYEEGLVSGQAIDKMQVL